MSYRLFGLSYRRPSPALRHQITKLERTQTTHLRDSEGTKEVKAQINIWAGIKKFEIGGNGLLSEIELDWLAHELSDWLGLLIIE